MLSFSGIISLQQSPQNVSWFHTRFQHLVHMIAICLTHFFVSNSNRYLATLEPRSRQLPESHSVVASWCASHQGASPSVEPNHPPAFRVARRRSQLGGAQTGLLLHAPAFSNMPHVFHVRDCDIFGRTEHVLALSGRVCAAPWQRAGFFSSRARHSFASGHLQLVAGAFTSSQ